MAEPRFMLDANSCIYLIEKLSVPLRRNAERFEPGALVTSSICYSEVAVGTDWKNRAAAALVNDFFESVAILPYDAQAARRYGDLPFRRHRLDRLIAAHALSFNLTLITANVRDFASIPDLKVEDWTV